MRKNSHRVMIAVALASLCCSAASAQSGTPGRIAKFVTTNAIGNSALFEKGGRIGLGTTAPVSSLDIRSTNALSLWSTRPFLTFRDTATTNSPSRIQGSNGGMTFFGQSAIDQSNPFALVRLDKHGRLGIGTQAPQRALQIGPNTNAMFTIEPADASPNAGYIRFGDGTGWQLHFGLSRNGSGGPLYTGTQGRIMTIQDKGTLQGQPGVGTVTFRGSAEFLGGTSVLLFSGGGSSSFPVCQYHSLLLTACSSSRRYKADIKPFSGGLQIVDRLQPVSFIWKEDQHPDIGLIAEEVAEVDPRLTFKNQDGAVEGVNYLQLATALINAVKEQQKEIEELKSAVARLEASQQ